MRKFVAGFVVAAVLLFTSQSFASTLSLVGKKVGSEAELYLDGKRMSDVIIVDGKSYAPVREIAENVGRSVYYKAPENGRKAIVNLSASLYAHELRIKTIKEKITELEGELAVIDKYEVSLREMYEGKTHLEEVQATLKEDAEMRAEKRKEINETIAGLRIELEALESAQSSK